MNLKPATILKCSLESTTSNIQKAAILFNYYSFTTQVRTDNQKRCKTTPNSEIAHVQPTTPGSMQKRNTGNFGHVKQAHKVFFDDANQLVFGFPVACPHSL